MVYLVKMEITTVTMAETTKLSNTTQGNEQNRLIGIVGRVFTNGPGDRGSIPGLVIPNTILKNSTWYLLA